MDLAEQWKRKVKKASARKGWGLFSSRDFAEWYDIQISSSGYPGSLLEKVLSGLDSSSTLLDIGAGTGAFAIPASARIAGVTAVEPSLQMSLFLENKMNGQKNIRIINKWWEDISLDEAGSHDTVLAANSLYRIEDILPALKKIVEAAGKYIYIIMSCKSGLFDDIWKNLKGEAYHPPPSYIHLYNILYSMGVMADVEIIRNKRRHIYKDMDQAIGYWSVRLDLGPEAGGALKKYLEGILGKTPEGLYYEEKGHDAVIRYQKR
jgi:SAM-dependent methyltransferase